VGSVAWEKEFTTELAEGRREIGESGDRMQGLRSFSHPCRMAEGWQFASRGDGGWSWI